MNEPKINFGVVKHRRFRPASNAFGYGVFTLSIPMRARKAHPELLSARGLKDNRMGLFSFFDKDHGQGTSDSLGWFEKILKENGIHHSDGEIWLHTCPGSVKDTLVLIHRVGDGADMGALVLAGSTKTLDGGVWYQFV